MKKLLVTVIAFIPLIVVADDLGETELLELSLGELLNVKVSSEKTEKDLQSAAFSVTVIASEELENNQYDNLVDIAYLVPNTQAGTIFSDVNFSSRGIGNSDFKAVDDGVVRLVVDGVSLAGSLFPWMNVFDIDRIEFVRGPQGTIHGRNAMSGVISVVTNQPTNEKELKTRLTLGNYNRRKLELVANTPITENLFTRFSLYSNNSEPFISDKALDRATTDVSDIEDIAMRFQSKWQITEQSEWTVKLEYESKEGYERPFSVVDLAGINLDTIPKDFTNLRDQTIKGISTQFSKEYADFEFVYIGDKHESEETQFLNVDPSVPFGVRQTTEATENQWSHELRAASLDSSEWEWVFGVNYFSQDQSRTTDILVHVPGINIFTDIPMVELKSESIFGQITKPHNDFAYTIGLRHSIEKANRRGTSTTDLTLIGGGISTSPEFGAAEWKNTVGKLGFSWFISENEHFYSSVSSGFKIGGFNPGLPPNDIGEEKVISWEVGYKTKLLDNKLRLNAATFYNEYSDLQVGQNVGSGANIQSIVQNVGKANTSGFELEWNWHFAEHWNISGYLSYLDAEYGSFSLPDPNPLNPPSQIDVTGNQLIKAPEFQANIKLQKQWALANDYELYFSWLSHYQSESFFSAFKTDVQSQDSFIKSDINFHLRMPKEGWDISLYVINLTDEQVFSEMSSSGVATLGVTDPGREIGLSVLKRF